MSEAILQNALRILRLNDLGHYTVPTHGLYPFQWNWDSCLTALGQAYSDEDRAWTEIETLLAHQWPDGMVPHIIFHKQDDGYFPGPEVWGTDREVPTSGITQPPVAGFTISRLYRRAKDRSVAEDRVRALLGKVHAWHEWFYACRDPGETGLVAIIHPWESGRDNSIDWDLAFDRVPTASVLPFQRRDLRHANPDHRPTHTQYEKYVWLVEHFRSLEWDNFALHDASPFRIVDPGFNAILLRSIAEIAELAATFGEEGIARQSRKRLAVGIAAMERLWHARLGQFTCFDRVSDSLIDSASIGGLLAVFAPLPRDRIEALASRIRGQATSVPRMVPSHDPSDRRFDGKRYWRGPIWLIANYLICDGLKRAGQADLAARIEAGSLSLIETGGFAEYYDPASGEPCGGGQFTWTAAMVIEFLSRARDAA